MLEIKIVEITLIVNLALFTAGLILILIFPRKFLLWGWDLRRLVALIMLGLGLVGFFQLTLKLVEENNLNEKNSLFWGQPRPLSQLPDGNFVVNKIIGQGLYVIVSKADMSKIIIYNDLKIFDHLWVGTEFTKNEEKIIFVSPKIKM